jgi:hypothetical protein
MDTAWMMKYKRPATYKAEHVRSRKSLPHRCHNNKKFDGVYTWANQQRQQRKDALTGKLKLCKPCKLKML